MKIVLLLAITVAAYVPAFDGGYNFDDKPLLERNRAVRSLKNIPLFFVSKEARVPWTHGDLQDDIYRPIQSTSFAISFYLWGDNPSAFHKENVLLHLLNGIVLYFLLVLLLDSTSVAFLAALLFLVHPVQVEAVTYLVERASVLSLLFVLISFYTFVLSERKARRLNRFALISLVCFSLGIFTKEIAVILPAVLVLYLACFRREDGLRVNTLTAKTWHYFVVALLYVVVRTANLGQVAQYETIPIGQRLLVMSEVFWGYLKLIVFPARLSFFPEVNAAQFGYKSAYFIYLAVVVVFIAMCIFIYRKHRQAAFFPMAYVVALLPVSNIIPIKTYMQERFLYYPSVFILAFVALLLVGAVRRLSERRGAAGRYVFVAMGGIAVLSLAARTHLRNRDWKDQETLMLKEATVNPANGRVYYDLAVSAFRDADYERSREFARLALTYTRHDVFRVQIYDLLGNLDRLAKQYDRALENYRAAIQSDPGYPFPYNSIGMIYVEQGRVKEAISNFEKAVERNPSDAVFNKNLGSAYSLDGETGRAIHYWAKSLELDPDQPRLRDRLLETQRNQGSQRVQ